MDQVVFEYEARAGEMGSARPDPESVRMTHVAGRFAVAGWMLLMMWAAIPPGSAVRQNPWALAVLCLLPLVGSGYLVGALLQPPTWWYTWVVGVMVGVLWFMLGVAGVMAVVRMVTG